MKFLTTILNRIRGRERTPLPPGNYVVIAKNVIRDELTGTMHVQLEVNSEAAVMHLVGVAQAVGAVAANPLLLRPLPENPEYPGWYKHDGGTCPVHPDPMVETGAGTYYSKTGTFIQRAGSFEWESAKIGHLRDEVGWFKPIVEGDDQ